MSCSIGHGWKDVRRSRPCRVIRVCSMQTLRVSTGGFGDTSMRAMSAPSGRLLTLREPPKYDLETSAMDDFYRIKRLPPYVFAIVNDLKTKARSKGQDIIDLGMGNPDQSTPKHIVVGLWGKDRMRSLALGHESLAASWRRAKKSSPGIMGTERRSPSAITTE